ncbi:HAD-IA family hydrolase [Candidatus Woesearchaeota archaeon]|nr:HAD-IA family hydrolase [Candidatus Woesearchaeota archaeon]
MSLIIFDLDFTLVDTRHLQVYRKNPEGNRFLKQNIFNIHTEHYSDALKKIAAYKHKKNEAVVVSDANKEQCRLLLEKHGYPDMPVLGSAGKPIIELEDICRQFNKEKEDCLVIGDSPKDILMAHHNSMASIGVTWSESEKRKEKITNMLKKSQPNFIIDNPEMLWERIGEFEKGYFEHEERKLPKRYSFIERFDSLEQEIRTISLADYHPRNWSSGETNEILAFKKSKDYFVDDIRLGKKDEYFYKERIMGNIVFKDIISGYIMRVAEKTSKLKGHSLMIAAPNSLPEFCYKRDPNNNMAVNINSRVFKNDVIKRDCVRLYPKQTSRDGYKATIHTHMETMGFRDIDYSGIDNIVIFDDVLTRKTQINSIGIGLRESGFNNNLYAITLGETTHL